LTAADISYNVVPDAPLKLLLTVARKLRPHAHVSIPSKRLLSAIKRDRDRPYGASQACHDPGEGVIVLPTDTHSPKRCATHVYGLMNEAFPGLPEL